MITLSCLLLNYASVSQQEHKHSAIQLTQLGSVSILCNSGEQLCCLRALKVFLCSTKLLQLRLMAWLCNDPASTRPFSNTAAIVSGLWQDTGIPQRSQQAIKVLQWAGPQAQLRAHGYPWVFWQQSFVAGHQRKHTDNRWPLLSSTQPWDFWLWVTKPTEQQRRSEARWSIWVIQYVYELPTANDQPTI